MSKSKKEKQYDPLLDFIKAEVPFRLREVLEFPEEKITEDIEQACIKTLYDDSDVMFDYDAIDRTLEDTCNELGLYKDEDDEDKDDEAEIITVCYGKERKWKSRQEAIEFYIEGIAWSEGSERERYTEILLQLEGGSTYCTDGEEL